MENNTINEEKRQLVWDSLMFLVSQRTKSLMKLNLIRSNKKLLDGEENKELKEARRIKSRILREIDINIKLLNNEDRSKLNLDDKSDF